MNIGTDQDPFFEAVHVIDRILSQSQPQHVVNELVEECARRKEPSKTVFITAMAAALYSGQRQLQSNMFQKMREGIERGISERALNV